MEALLSLRTQHTEGSHQQYLHKVPYGYCPSHSTGVSCPAGLGVKTTD